MNRKGHIQVNIQIIVHFVSGGGPGDNEGEWHHPKQTNDGHHDGQGVVQLLVLNEHLMAGDLHLVTHTDVGSDVSSDILLKLALLHNEVCSPMSEEVNVAWIIWVFYEEVWHRHCVHLLNVDVQFISLLTLCPAVIKAPYYSFYLDLSQDIAKHPFKVWYVHSHVLFDLSLEDELEWHKVLESELVHVDPRFPQLQQHSVVWGGAVFDTNTLVTKLKRKN